MITTKLRFAENEPQTQQGKKAALREYAKKRRGDNANRDLKEALLIENFYQAVFGETGGAGTRRTFFIYLSFGLEAPTDKLIECLKADGHEVYCPRLEREAMVAAKHSEELALSDYGIREPVGEVYAGAIEIAVVPFLAVDRQGNRLGYGGGYYDRYLKNSNAKRVAYGYGFQVLNAVPHEEWDERMDMIVTDEEIIEVEQRQ